MDGFLKLYLVISGGFLSIGWGFTQAEKGGGRIQGLIFGVESFGIQFKISKRPDIQW